MDIIEVEGVSKRFGATEALSNVDLVAESGHVLALLGPNGAGKTTLVRILATLLHPDEGRATVAGLDVVREAGALRPLIGLAGQFAAVDELLTGRENVELIGTLYHLSRSECRRRAGEILDRISLNDAADRQVRTYSGGMRRRLDLAASLVGRPPVVYLDEPTTGLDPRTRNDLWELIRELVGEGATVLLTTQYMEEAEHLAHRIAVLDEGYLVAEGTSEELKHRVGGDVLEVRVADPSDLGQAADILASVGDGPVVVDRDLQRATVPTKGGTSALIRAGELLESRHVELVDLGLRRPSLDDVFLALTGTGDRASSKAGIG